MAHLRECPSCSCGVSPDSDLCEFCSAVVCAQVDTLSVVAIICNQCGFQNEPLANRCAACRKDLLGLCPRCGREIRPRVERECHHCGLRKEGFYEECVRLEAAREEARARSEKVRERTKFFLLAFFFTMALLLAVASWFTHSMGDMDQRNGLLAASLLFLLFWLLTLRLSKVRGKRI